jgi:hypothetical protein
MRLPFNGKSRASLDFHLRRVYRHLNEHRRYQLAAHRLMDNDRATEFMLDELFFNRDDFPEEPVFLDGKLLREIFINSYMKHDHHRTGKSSLLQLARRSFSNRSFGKGRKKKKKLLELGKKLGEDNRSHGINEHSLDTRYRKQKYQVNSTFQACRLHPKEKSVLLGITLSSEAAERIPKCLTNLKNLESLSVINLENRNKMRSIDNLGSLKKLKVLKFRGHDIGFMGGLDGLVDLRWFSVPEGNISKIEGLESLDKLEGMILRNNEIEKIENIDHLSRLQYIDLSDNHVKDIKSILTVDEGIEIDASKNIIKLEDCNKLKTARKNVIC